VALKLFQQLAPAVAALKRALHLRRGNKAPGRFIKRTYANHAGTRTYKTYLPARYRGQSLPLVVMLHGCRQTPDDFAAGTRMNQLADEIGFIVVYPAQAPAPQMRPASEASMRDV